MTRQKWILILLQVILLISVLWVNTLGAVSIGIEEIGTMIRQKITGNASPGITGEAIFWSIRLPRVLMSVIAGAALAICGAAMQGLFRNPLADPSIIGISGGAMLAAASVIILLGSMQWSVTDTSALSLLSIATFAGAVLASILIFRMSRIRGRTDVATMLLGGIAINALAGALTGLLIQVADDAQLRTLTFWTMGSLAGASWKTVLISAICLVLVLWLLLPLHKSLNALALGEQEAVYLGVNTEQVKNRIILLTALAVGGVVAFCGMIGFVGLVIPHILRLVGGSDHRYLLPASALGGALLLVWADTLSRTAAAPAEIAIGVITSLAGAPVFLALLLRRTRSNTI